MLLGSKVGQSNSITVKCTIFNPNCEVRDVLEIEVAFKRDHLSRDFEFGEPRLVNCARDFQFVFLVA